MLAMPQLLFNPASRVYHATLTPADWPAQLQRSVCGWAFATRMHERPQRIPEGTAHTELCPRCLRTERELARVAELSDVD